MDVKSYSAEEDEEIRVILLQVSHCIEEPYGMEREGNEGKQLLSITSSLYSVVFTICYFHKLIVI